jgi:hypothetical protein
LHLHGPQTQVLIQQAWLEDGRTPAELDVFLHAPDQDARALALIAQPEHRPLTLPILALHRTCQTRKDRDRLGTARARRDQRFPGAVLERDANVYDVSARPGLQHLDRTPFGASQSSGRQLHAPTRASSAHALGTAMHPQTVRCQLDGQRALVSCGSHRHGPRRLFRGRRRNLSRHRPRHGRPQHAECQGPDYPVPMPLPPRRTHAQHPRLKAAGPRPGPRPRL